jgi:prophage antirepressor-like protein
MDESTATPGTSAAALTFTFSTTQDLRVIMIDDEAWYVAADVADILEYNHVPSMVRMCEEDEKGVQNVHTLGGEQKMTVISEPGLFRVITNSRSERTKPFQRKLYHEILPAIRKTGAYVAPNAPQATTPPAHTAERLTGNDMLNLKRRIGFCTRGFFYESAWNQGLWVYLRALLCLPSPQPFTVEHLPVLAAELQRIHTVTHQVQAIIADIEQQAVKRIFRKGEAADLVLADIKRTAELRLAEVQDDIARLPGYFQSQHQNLLHRAPHCTGVNYGVDEKLGYFDKQGVAA